MIGYLYLPLLVPVGLVLWLASSAFLKDSQIQQKLSQSLPKDPLWILLPYASLFCGKSTPPAKIFFIALHKTDVPIGDHRIQHSGVVLESDSIVFQIMFQNLRQMFITFYLLFMVSLRSLISGLPPSAGLGSHISDLQSSAEVFQWPALQAKLFTVHVELLIT